MSGAFGQELSARFGAALHFYECIDSTQQAARVAARAGEPEGALFVAEQQTAGRGRHGHSWISPAGAGVYATLLLRPRRPTQKMLWLTLAAGLAIADAVESVAGVQPELRWPNDLLVQGRKFCGLLLEAEGRAAVLGFGINIRPCALPPELHAIATCLDEHTASPCDRAQLCITAVEALLHHYARWNTGADAAIRQEFERRSRYARGLAVTVEGSWSGVTEGLDADGFLRVRTPDGSIRTVVSGDVRPATDN